ncbi:hypothetical protein [Spirosoma validum]|uniref:Tetratricopeptide repeat protein n=1 Tax=Spirosoma validum TaxID=2771355 RepID=A0A927GF66_9BACT|nr:hypothetical protein [Spirosoma validum]MBD2755320.1 hypothetical protein [Spirosoma validum]
MKTDLETIENYLTGQLPSDERAQFEATLRTDPDVANAVAFYLMTKQVAQDEAREQRRTELDALRTKNVPVRPLWSAPMRWAAAASVIVLLGLGWVFFRPTDSTVMASRLADEYVAEHFRQLPLTMGGGPSGSSSEDSVKTAVSLFNDGKLAQAELIFQDVLTRQPNMDSALKYAGIVSLRQGNYDKAITLFHRLSQQPDLVANPGTFYEALAHLKRGQPLDKSQAEKLLEEVINKNLEGKQEAEVLLNQL